ncbi:MAG TPA: nitrogenase component 1 [Verrucomicrobiae bacterium]
MSKQHHVEQARAGCALHGALAAFGAIEGVTPIVHATAGCGIQYARGVTPFGGALPQCASWGPPVSSTNISEKHVVFGGGSRLREQLKNTVKVVSADLYTVVSSCATEMVGDDIGAMTKEGKEQGFPVVFANTPGFWGAVHAGYETAAKALIEQLPPATSVESKKLVNLWGVIPQQDVFWQGHLLQLAQLVRSLGCEANLLFGAGQGVAAWKQIPGAALNVVLSPWGEKTARLLEEKYQTPWLSFSGLPIGPRAIGRFLKTLAEKFGADLKPEAVQQSEQAFDAWLTRLAPAYFQNGWQREFAVVGEVSLVYGLTEFFTDTLGLVPKLVVLTDPLSEEQQQRWLPQLEALVKPWSARVMVQEDTGEIADLISQSDVELIVGSSLEREVADRLNVPLLPVSFPVADRLVLNRGYVGYDGALALIEDLGTALLQSNYA